ncbi:hypothetical protein [Rubritalea tangerina]|uniref:hypothetical protein n=1 Tax=Rubritalea tangerina TaxID=430798 RepID=UPI003607B7E6
MVECYTISRLGIDEWGVVKSCVSALRDFRLHWATLHNVIAFTQLSRTCGAPSLLLAILQAHSDHSSILL